LFSADSREFFLVDPRGDDNIPVIYDLAKLSHSINGGYDFILSGNYNIRVDNNGLELQMPEAPSFLLDSFERLVVSLEIGTFDEVRLLEAYLFASMIKFHIDEPRRCLAFVLQSKKILTCF